MPLRASKGRREGPPPTKGDGPFSAKGGPDEPPFLHHYLLTLTWLGFPLPLPSQGTRPKRTKKPRERGKTWRAPVGGHMPLPARGGTTLSRLRRNAGKGGRALTLAHTHTPRRATGPHPPSTHSAAPNVQAQWPRAVRGPPVQRMAPNCHPPSPASPLPPPPLHAPRATACPLTRLTFSDNLLTGLPHTSHPTPPQGGRSPGLGRKTTEFNDTLGFLFSPFSS